MSLSKPFNQWPDPEDYKAVPLGEYLARCISADDTKTTNDGFPLWNLEFKIVEGEYTGSHFWDNLCWTENQKTWQRAKLMATRMGVPKDMDRDLLPADLLEKLVYVTLEAEVGRDGRERNKPTYAGYRRYVPENPGQEKMFEGAGKESEEVPF